MVEKFALLITSVVFLGRPCYDVLAREKC